MFKGLLVIVAAAAATSAAAGATRLSDVQYIQASRCHALITSPALGGGDDSAIKAMIDGQVGIRPQYIVEKAAEAKRDAQRQAKRANAGSKAMLIAERDGACQAFNGAASATATAGVSGTHNTN